jgi:hypothetical protein
MTTQQTRIEPAGLAESLPTTPARHVRFDQAVRFAKRTPWLVALAAYAAMTIAITFPLIFHLGDSIMGPYTTEDNLWYTWYAYAFHQALANGQDPAYTHLIYALLPHIQLFAASYTSGAAGAVLINFMTPLAVFNVLLMLNFILSGFTTYLLVQEFVPNRWVAFIAGGMYTFSTYHFWRVLSGLSLSSMQWMPLAIWRIFAFYRRPTWRNALFMGLSVALLPLSDLYLTAYFVPIFAVLFLIGMVVSNRAWFANRQNILRAVVGFALAAVVVLPLLASSLHTTPDIEAAIALPTIRGRPAPAIESVLKFSGSILAYFVPQQANPIFGALTARIYAPIASATLPESAEYLGWVALFLAIFGFVATRKRPRTMYFFLALGISALLLSLGPELQLGNRVVVALPFYGWLYDHAVLSGFRAPNRIAPVVLLSVCILAAFGLDALFARLGAFVRSHDVPGWLGRWATPLLGALVIGASLAESIQFAIPYPFTQVAIPPVYQMMADDPAPGLVLSLPIYPHGSDMFYQTITHRGLVTGYPIRTTYTMIRTFENIPGVSLFDWPDTRFTDDPQAGAEGRLHDIFSMPGSETLLQGLQANHVRYVVLRADTTGPSGQAFPPIEPWMRPFLEAQLGTPFYDSSRYGITVWRIPQEAVAPDVTRFVLGDGWMPGLQVANDQDVRRILQDAELDVYVPQATTATLRITALAVATPHTMTVTVNGSTLTTVDFTTPGAFQTVDLGVAMLHAGKNVLHFASAQQCVDPSANYPLTFDPTCRAFEVSALRIEPVQTAAVP